MSIKIVVTGPESTGKTSLCTQLAHVYKGTMIPEFSREYLGKMKHYYQKQDIVNIGLQQSLNNNQNNELQNFIFCDTDVLTSYIWMSEKFNEHSKQLYDVFLSDIPTLYLLCYPDLPWESDDLRESKDHLKRLFGLHYKHIVAVKANYTLVEGTGRIRLNRTMFFINNFLRIY